MRPPTALTPSVTGSRSYGIPVFRLEKDFAAVLASKGNCGLHTMSKAIPVSMSDELKAAGISTSGTTLRIGTDIDLPVSLVEKVLRAPCGVGGGLTGLAMAQGLDIGDRICWLRTLPLNALRGVAGSAKGSRPGQGLRASRGVES